MRKVMLLAAMLAMVLAAAAPALAQTANAVAGDVSGNVQYRAVCQNVFDEITAAGYQYGNVGDNFAGGDLAQAIAQEQGVSVEVVNACLNAFFFGFGTASPSASATASPTASATASPTASPTATPTATATATASATATATALPSTGGPAVPSSMLALGAGALLVAGGLLARRIVR